MATSFGSWRRPSSEEWAALQAGRDPWERVARPFSLWGKKIMDQIGHLIQEAKHHHAGRENPLDMPGRLPPFLARALHRLEHDTTLPSAAEGGEERRDP